MPLVWFHCVFCEYLAFIVLSDLLQIIYLPGGQYSLSLWLELELLPLTLNTTFLQQLSLICRISVQFHGIQAVSLTISHAFFMLSLHASSVMVPTSCHPENFGGSNKNVHVY